MNGEVPEIYWYVSWVRLAIVVEAFGFFMATIIHRRNMRVLDLLKSYADKGIEPLGGVAERLSEQAKDPGRAVRATPRSIRAPRRQLTTRAQRTGWPSGRRSPRCPWRSGLPSCCRLDVDSPTLRPPRHLASPSAR